MDFRIKKLILLAGFVLVLALVLPDWGCRDGGGDSVRGVRARADYKMALGGEEILRFSVPELAGCGLPRVDVGEAEEGGWRRVRMTWDLPAAVAQDELKPSGRLPVLVSKECPIGNGR